MNKQAAIDKARREWIKSGAYRTVSFEAWYNARVNKMVNSWFKAA